MPPDETALQCAFVAAIQALDCRRETWLLSRLSPAGSPRADFSWPPRSRVCRSGAGAREGPPAIAAGDGSTMVAQAGTPRESRTSSSRRAAIRGSPRTITASTCGALVAPRGVTAIDRRVVDGQPLRRFQHDHALLANRARSPNADAGPGSAPSRGPSRSPLARPRPGPSLRPRASGLAGPARYREQALTPRYRAAPTWSRRCRGRWLPCATGNRSVKSRRAVSGSSHADAPRPLP